MDLRVVVAVSLFVLACGGQSERQVQAGSSGPGSGGTGGTGTGGSGATGGSMATGGSGAIPNCCGSQPVCGPGELQVTFATCVSSPTCREVTACCTTIYCDPSPICDGIPVRDEGDTELPSTCPPDVELYCYERERCGSVITCRDDFCDPEGEHNRRYVGDSPDACAAIDFACTGETISFYNACGCGCEQDPSCPEYLDCSPTSDPNMSCTPELMEMCPFSQQLR